MLRKGSKFEDKHSGRLVKKKPINIKKHFRGQYIVCFLSMPLSIPSVAYSAQQSILQSNLIVCLRLVSRLFTQDVFEHSFHNVLKLLIYSICGNCGNCIVSCAMTTCHFDHLVLFYDILFHPAVFEHKILSHAEARYLW